MVREESQTESSTPGAHDGQPLEGTTRITLKAVVAGTDTPPSPSAPAAVRRPRFVRAMHARKALARLVGDMELKRRAGTLTDADVKHGQALCYLYQQLITAMRAELEDDLTRAERAALKAAARASAREVAH